MSKKNRTTQTIIATLTIMLTLQSTGVAQVPSSGLRQRKTMPTKSTASPNANSRPQRVIPSASTGTNGSFGNVTRTKTGLPKLGLGNYVELEESLKDEAYEGTIDYPDSELTEILGAISKLANKNFILDNSLKGKRITIMSPQKVTKEEAYNVFLTALFMNGLTLVSSGKYLRVISSRDAPKSNVRVFYGDFVPASDEIVTLVYPLKNISSEDMPRIFQDLLPRTGNILVYPETNSVIMTDSGLNLRRMISILKSLDVPGSQPKLESIPINYASAEDLAKLIDEILDAQSGGRSRTASTSSRLQKERKIQGGGVITKIVPDKRTNSLVVLANGKGLDQLRSLVQKLDNPNATNSGNIHVYFVKNAVAEEMATTLNNLLGAGGSASSQAPRSLPTTGATTGGPTNTIQPAFQPRGGGQTEGVSLEGQIKVVADKPTNALVIRASATNFTALSKILEKIDIPRRQVNVEATIMEIKTDEIKRFVVGSNVAVTGLNQAGGFIPSFAKSDLAAALTGTGAGLNGLIAGVAAGGTIKNGAVTLKGFTGLIQAIQDYNLGQILQQPNILTTDNETGTVSIRQRVSTQGESTVQQVGTQNVVTNKPGKEDVLLELKVTPQIGEDNELIKIKTEQTLTDFITSTIAAGQIDTTERKAVTVVTVRNGDMVAIGGLQKSTVQSNRSKVPVLGDLPIIGNLFKGKNDQVIKTNLIVFLTPKIIRDNRDLLNFTAERLEQRKLLSNEAYDPKDFHRKEMRAFKKDVDERIKGKNGWGYKQNTSAYLRDDAPYQARQQPVEAPADDEAEAPPVTPRQGRTNTPNNGANVNAPMGNGNELLPSPPDDEPLGLAPGGGGSDADLDTLNVR